MSVTCRVHVCYSSSHIHMHISTYTYLYMCIYACIYTYIYIYIGVWDVTTKEEAVETCLQHAESKDLISTAPSQTYVYTYIYVRRGVGRDYS